MNVNDHINACKPWKRYKLQELSHSAKRTISILMSKSTIIQAYTDTIYIHTQKNIVGAGPPQMYLVSEQSQKDSTHCSTDATRLKNSRRERGAENENKNKNYKWMKLKIRGMRTA